MEFESQDIISNLPDSIIAHILSFLSTKQVLRTSVVSKRWTYMWTFLTKLSFDDRDTNRSNMSVSFSKIVNRVLFHINTTTIQEFHLSLSENYDPDYINQWISAILNRGVKKIKISILQEYNISCYPLFKCRTLEELVFEMSTISTMKFPSFVFLPSLTILKLVGVRFTCYSSNELKELTLSFPLLREYVTHVCSWSNLNNITIEAPLLESIDIISCIESLSHVCIKFCATNITKFSYKSPVTEFFNLLKVNDLVEHYLDGISTFQMLAHLHLRITSDILLGILFKSPCLETLVFEMVDHDEEPLNFAIVPECFITTLKVVKFDRYFGGDRALSFSKFVMENAKVLEGIYFSFPKLNSRFEVENTIEQLRLIKINSSKAIMDFSY